MTIEVQYIYLYTQNIDLCQAKLLKLQEMPGYLGK